MKRKNNTCKTIVLISVAIVIFCVGLYVCMDVFVFKPSLERYNEKKEFLAPFYEVYDELREKHPSIVSISDHLGAGDHYCMYYIECDIAEDADCFAEFVDIHREIYTLMEARKDDEWFKEFKGHIVIDANGQRLRANYWNGSITREFWADDIISDDYSALWDAFPELDEIYLVIWLTDYSEETKSEILRKNEGRKITVEPRLGSELTS